MWKTALRFGFCVFCALAVTSCGGASGLLGQAERAYDEARYEDAEVWLDEAEHQMPGEAAPTRTAFHYLRGMTAFRLEQRHEARHHLALARSLLAGEEASLPATKASRLERTLRVLQALPQESDEPETSADR